MDELLEAFRQGLRESGVRPGVGIRYPEFLRELAVGYFELARRAGHSRRQVVEALGVADATLQRWDEEVGTAAVEAAESVALHEVVLTDSRPSGSLRLITPEGYRVEGLGIGELAELLRALR